MKNNIILITCPPFWIKTPPVGMAVLKSYLESFSYRSRLLDLNIRFFRLMKDFQSLWQKSDRSFEESLFSKALNAVPGGIEDITESINSSSAKYIGFSLFKRNLNFSVELANRISAEKCVIFGGPEVFYDSFEDFSGIKKILKRKNAYFVVGEGEKAFLDILKGQAESTVRFSEIEELDSLPFYDFSGFDMKEYRDPFTAPLLSSRGCIGKCAFCAERMLYKSYRRHSADYMIKQIKHIKTIHGVKSFSFQDSLFNADLDWVNEFAAKTIKENLDIKWDCQMMIRAGLDTQFFRKLKDAGCFNIFFGFENASEKVLNDMNKPHRQDKALEVFESACKAGMHFEISLIIGYPSETEEDFLQTFEFIRKNKRLIPKIAQVNPYVPLRPVAGSAEEIPADIVQDRISRLVDMFEQEGIRYTKAFINNFVSI